MSEYFFFFARSMVCVITFFCARCVFVDLMIFFACDYFFAHGVWLL